MASRVPRESLLKSLRYFTRPLNSATTTSAAAAAVSPLIITAADDADVSERSRLPTPAGQLKLDDHEKLFASVSTAKLLRASANLQAAAVKPVADMGMWVMRSRLMETEVVRELILGIIRHTFFEHFCAGEDAVEAGRTVLRLREAGIRGMLVYALEYAAENDACDRNLDGFIRTVHSTKSLPPSSVSRRNQYFFNSITINETITYFCFIFLYSHFSSISFVTLKTPIAME